MSHGITTKNTFDVGRTRSCKLDGRIVLVLKENEIAFKDGSTESVKNTRFCITLAL